VTSDFKMPLRESVSCMLLEVTNNSSAQKQFSIDPASKLASAIELYFPSVLRHYYAEWQRESLDGVFVLEGNVQSKSKVHIAGVAIVISDQCLTPFDADFELTHGEPFVSGQLRIGESGAGRLKISGPTCNSPEGNRYKDQLLSRLKAINWVYDVELC
jgi:hypothetical protein